MSDNLAHLMADKNWGYIWPCYALAVITFGGLAVRAIVQLRQWEKRAQDLTPAPVTRKD
jgi:hypothetical protein